MRTSAAIAAAALIAVAASAGAIAQTTTQNATTPTNSAPQAAAVAPAAGATKASMHMKSRMSRKEVEDVQSALNRSGYKLAVDGHIGPMTRDALKKYQTSHNLKATGTPDRETIKSLGVT